MSNDVTDWSKTCSVDNYGNHPMYVAAAGTKGYKDGLSGNEHDTTFCDFMSEVFAYREGYKQGHSKSNREKF